MPLGEHAGTAMDGGGGGVGPAGLEREREREGWRR